MNVLKLWLDKSSTQQKRALAEAAGTTVASIRYAAYAARSNGEVSVSADYAQRIVEASKSIDDPLLPTLRVEDLCPTCRNCEYAKLCRK